PFGPRPDILISRSGTLIAARGEDGRLSALAGRADQFDLGRWLERDGDGRNPASVADPAQSGSIFTCDSSGCVARVRERRLAASRHPAALRDDCERADILVLRQHRPAECAASALVIDAAALRREGAHALTFRGTEIVVTTVAGQHGRRPWSVEPSARPPQRPRLPRRAPPAERRPPSGLLEVAAPESEAGPGDD
ncbi:MAG: hypothetical protein J0I57_22955, partial [Hyphomicrobium sp.]|nr:hypothetical protein [Hyphomicrobium sp.]